MKQKLKIIIKIASIIMVCAICIVSMTYSWFQNVNYEGNQLGYNKNLIISGGTVNITNYYGIVQNADTSTISFTEITGSFVLDNLYPGVKQYFRTVMSNASTKAVFVSASIAKVVFDPELLGLISIVATSPSNKNADTSTATSFTDTDGNNLYQMTAVSLSDTLTIPAGGSVTIYWYLQVSEDAGNNCINKNVNITSIQAAT